MTAQTSARTCPSCGARIGAWNTDDRCAPCGKQSSASTGTTPWLWTEGRRPAPPDGSNLGDLLKAWLAANHMSQSALAEMLGWPQPKVSRVANGHMEVRDVDDLWQIHRVLGIPTAALGLVAMQQVVAEDGVARTSVRRPAESRDVVAQSQREWLAARASLNRDRQELVKRASDLYPHAQRVAGSPVLTIEEWLPSEPIPFESLQLGWFDNSNRSGINGTEDEAAHVHPLANDGRRYNCYSHAVRDLDRPNLFENRPAYRLLTVEGNHFDFGYTSYFRAAVDTCGALSHEAAAVSLGAGGDMKDLSFRALVGDPFDLTRRELITSINTLTIRKDRNRSSFLLHYRDPGSVAVVAGRCHVMPCGVFQPSSLAPSRQANDFNFWRSASREFAEELLNLPEADGSSPDPIDYDTTEPFASMEAARRAGSFRMWHLGLGLDPLSLYGEFLSVAVVDAPVFDEIFADIAPANAEGSLMTTDPKRLAAGVPFTEESIRRLTDPRSGGPQLAPAADALLRLAWQHRRTLLG